MRRLLYFTLSLIMISSCTLDSSDNGALDGYWQLSSIDTLANGHSVNMRDSGIFWAFNFNLLVTRSTKEPLGEILYDFENTDDNLILSNPYILYRDSSDIKVTDVNLLKKYGVNSLLETFTIEHLNSNKMVLQSNLVRLNFRKY
ncbi:MAG: lipocalin-like domain-containing protein [Prevotella sp.]|nr:lipocalin-like domain-containing protein [Prevotella sp.]MBR6592311.1 lipocalin-like domain-containing protein [Prevotella sp.]